MSALTTAGPTIANLISGAGKPQEAASKLSGFVPPAMPTTVSPKAPTASLGKQVVDSIGSEWFPSFLLRQIERAGPADPTFKGVFQDDDNFHRYTEGLSPDFWSPLANATSDREATIIHSQMQKLQGARQELANAGWTGTALRLIASVTDPAMIALGAATGGAAWAAKGSLAVRMVKGGLLASASAVPFEAYMASQDPQRDNGDVLRAVAGSFVLGSGFTALGSALKLSKAVRSIQDDAIIHDMIGSKWSMGASSPGEFWSPEVRAQIRENLLSENGRARFKEGLDPNAKRGIVDMMIEGSGLDPLEHADVIEGMKALDPDEFLQRWVQADEPVNVHVAPEVLAADDAAQSAASPPTGGTGGAAVPAQAGGGVPAPAGSGGAAAPPAPPPPPPKDAFGFQPKHVSSARSDMAGVRLDIASLLGASESPTMRMALRYGAQDALLAKQASGASKGKFVPATDSATEWIRREYRRQVGNMATTYNTLSDRFYEANGGNWLKAGKIKRQFDDSVARAVRSDQAYQLATGAVKEAADVVREHMNYVLQVAKSHGVEDALSVTGDANYLTRLWSRSAITKYQAKHGAPFVNELLSGSIRSMYPNMSASVSDKVAEGMLKKIMRYGEHLDVDNARLHNMGPETLRDILTNEVSGISPQEIDRVLAQAVDTKHAGVSTNRLRERTVLDETHAIRAANGDWVQLQDLLENSTPKLVSLYTRQMLGASAEAEMLRGMSAATGKQLRSYEDLRGFVEKELSSIGIDKARASRELKTLDIVRGHIRGLPTGAVLGAITGDSQAGKVLRILRGYNYVRSSGGFGIAQIPEFVGALAEPGMKVMAQQMPVLADVFSRAKTGKLTNEFLAEIEAIWGSGIDHHIEAFSGHLDDFGTEFEQGLTRAERTLHSLNRKASIASGFTAIDSAARKWAAVAAVQRLANIAAGRKVSLKRLYELGLNQTQAQRVFDQINNPNIVETVEGAFGRRVKRINFNKWTDPQAKADFITAVDKWANRVVQTNDIGSSNRFMTDELGKTIGQFRSFVMNGYAKNTLHRLQMHDQEAAQGAIAAWIGGSLAFMGQTYIASVGRQDAEKFRAERLTPSSIALVGWSRSGWGSILPGVIDNGLSVGGFDPLFKFGRYSGLDTTGAAQNPTGQLIDSGVRTVSAGVKLIRSGLGGKKHRLSQADTRSFVNLLPFNQVVGMKNMLDSFVTSRPKNQ